MLRTEFDDREEREAERNRVTTARWIFVCDSEEAFVEQWLGRFGEQHRRNRIEGWVLDLTGGRLWTALRESNLPRDICEDIVVRSCSPGEGEADEGKALAALVDLMRDCDPATMPNRARWSLREHAWPRLRETLESGGLGFTEAGALEDLPLPAAPTRGEQTLRPVTVPWDLEAPLPPPGPTVADEVAAMVARREHPPEPRPPRGPEGGRAPRRPGIPRPAPVWQAVGAGLLIVLLAIGYRVFLHPLRQVPSKEAGFMPAIDLLPLGAAPRLDASATKIDPGRFQEVIVRFTDPDAPAGLSRVLKLYESRPGEPREPGGLVSLSALDCPGARPFPAEAPGIGTRYQLVLEAVPFGGGVTSVGPPSYVQPISGRLQMRTTPWPVSIESPRQGQVLDAPFPVEGRAYEDGVVQLRTKPKMWDLYYLKGSERVRAGTDFGPIPVMEGGTEGFELYVLFARREEDLPKRDPVRSLPFATGRVDVIGPVDITVRPKHGPIRTLAKRRSELELAEETAAEFTAPPGGAGEPPEVTWEYRCSGRISPRAAKRDLWYVLAVVHGDHAWFQSPPWRMEQGKFDDKLVRFGMRNETAPEVRFELWLMAVEPQARGAVREGEPWLASSLPDGYVRVASVAVVKRTGEVK